MDDGDGWMTHMSPVRPLIRPSARLDLGPGALALGPGAWGPGPGARGQQSVPEAPTVAVDTLDKL